MALTISGSTGIAGVDGSASTPALQGSDTNTGIVFPAADTVTVATGGTERMRVNSSGNVGIGTTTPSQVLDVSGSANVTGTVIMGSSFLRNRIINGGMDIDQRNAGASQTITAAAALAYTVDRWYAYCTGANVTGQRVAGTAPSQYAYKFTGATSNTLVGFGQRIEQLNSYDLASSAVTFSAYMTASTNTTITWYLYTPTTTADTFGTIASPTVTQIATGTFSVTTTRTQFSATISSATMSGYNKGLELRFVAASGLGNTVTWTIEQVQLEAGSVATPFERRQYGQEFTLCQRYYEKSYADDKAPGATLSAGGLSIGGLAGGFTFPFNTRKRTAATVTGYDAAGTSGKSSYYSGAWLNGAGYTVLTGYQNGIFIQVNTGSQFNCEFTASAEL